MNTIRLILGDSLVKLQDLDDCSIDAVITDPPYEISFMTKSWDSSGIAFSAELWSQCFRVLKPEGVLKAFSGTRTFHRMIKAMRGAGFVDFEVHAWTYGSGFPKSMNICKAVEAHVRLGGSRSTSFRQTEQETGGELYTVIGTNNGILGKTKVYYRKKWGPTTVEAKQWLGYGNALKPAWEPIVVARKPF